jgi:D-arabinose 1-dehydrogenase-like Zn-dependent alcohol dehydrogenase
MGLRTAAIALGPDKKELALSFGAHYYIDSAAEDPAEKLQALGGASVIVATASSPATFGPLLRGLEPKGQLIVVGAGAEPMQVKVGDLLFGEHVIAGINTGTPIEIEDTLNFSLLEHVRATIETVPFERAPEAYARMLANKARFRMVIEMSRH